MEGLERRGVSDREVNGEVDGSRQFKVESKDGGIRGVLVLVSKGRRFGDSPKN
jgi:hypothetical protein